MVSANECPPAHSLHILSPPHLNGGEVPELVQLGLLRVVRALVSGRAAERAPAAHVHGAAARGLHLGDAAHQAGVHLLLGVGVDPLDLLGAEKSRGEKTEVV